MISDQVYNNLWIVGKFWLTVLTPLALFIFVMRGCR